MPIRGSLVALLIVVAGCRASSKEPAPPPGPRVVAIGDLHGDLEATTAVLRLAGLIDGSGSWSGGDAIFVQTGDTLDRGPDSKAILDLLRKLGPEATAAGGRVVPLLGNHEAMNVLGDWRYVSPEDLERFGGLDARTTAMALDGEYGAWLSGLDAVAKVGDTVFLHGGMTPTWASKGIDPTNAAIREALRGGPADVLGETGPLWYRGYVLDPVDIVCPDLERALTSLGARRMVVGHTTQRSGRIGTRCDGRLLAIDTGISEHYGGHLAALELVGSDARALYADGASDLADPPEPEPDP